MGLGIGDQLLRRMHGQRGRHHGHPRAPGHIGDRGEALQRIVVQVLVHRRRDDEARALEQERVAVGLGERRGLHADGGAGARTVLDHDALLELDRKMLRQEPRHHIDRRSGRERRDHPDRARRIVGRAAGKAAPLASKVSINTRREIIVSPIERASPDKPGCPRSVARPGDPSPEAAGRRDRPRARPAPPGWRGPWRARSQPCSRP